jgi:hypothetical protein
LTDDQLDAAFNECMLNYPIDVDEFPLDFQQIHVKQVADATITALPDGNRFTTQVYKSTDLICCHDDNNQWKIVIPPSLIDDTIEWYHAMLDHCGATCMINTMKTHICFPQMQQLIVDYVRRCNACQCFKNAGHGAGHVPPREDIGVLWEEVAVDLIVSWSIEGMGTIHAHALTMIDMTSRLLEIKHIENKTSSHITIDLKMNGFLVIQGH